MSDSKGWFWYDWYSVSPSSITLQLGSEFTGNNTSSNSMQFTSIQTSYGNGFSSSDGGIMCNFTGYALVSFTSYVRTSLTGVKQFYLAKNNNTTYSLNIATACTVADQVCSGMQLIEVDNGDILKIYGRTWSDSVTFTVTADSFTRLTIQKLVATS